MDDKPETTKRPWQILNERDKGSIVTHFLYGLSPSQIATVTKRSLPFIYEVLSSDEAQETIQKFEQERESGLMQVGDALSRASVGFVDELINLALNGKKEATRLGAVKHGLALAGHVPVQKIARVDAKVMLPAEAFSLAKETMDWLRRRREDSTKLVGGGNGHAITEQLANALNSAGPGRFVSIDLAAGRAAPGGLEGGVPAVDDVPGEGGAWVRQADGIPPPADLRDVGTEGSAPEVGGTAQGSLQEHDGHEDVSALAPDQRSLEKNPYY